MTTLLIEPKTAPGGIACEEQAWGTSRGAVHSERAQAGNLADTACSGETVAQRPAFRDAFRRWRCLVPASGFYEWQAVSGHKQLWYMRPTGAGLFGLAGITALWKGVHSVSLITTAPNELMQPIHDRMPLIVAPQDYAAWLDAENQDTDALMSFVRPYPAERMAARRVSMRVNQPENDEPALIEEATSGPLQHDLL